MACGAMLLFFFIIELSFQLISGLIRIPFSDLFRCFQHAVMNLLILAVCDGHRIIYKFLFFVILIFCEENDSAAYQAVGFRVRNRTVRVVKLDISQFRDTELRLLAALAVGIGEDNLAVFDVNTGCQHGNQDNQSDQKDNDGNDQRNGPDDGAASQTFRQAEGKYDDAQSHENACSQKATLVNYRIMSLQCFILL